jgi:hypothetical protein
MLHKICADLRAQRVIENIVLSDLPVDAIADIIYDGVADCCWTWQFRWKPIFEQMGMQMAKYDVE